MLKNTDIKEMQVALDTMEDRYKPEEIDDPETLRFLLRNAWKMCNHALQIIITQNRALDDILVRAEVDQAIAGVFEKEENNEKRK